MVAASASPPPRSAVHCAKLHRRCDAPVRRPASGESRCAAAAARRTAPGSGGQLPRASAGRRSSATERADVSASHRDFKLVGDQLSRGDRKFNLELEIDFPRAMKKNRQPHRAHVALLAAHAHARTAPRPALRVRARRVLQLLRSAPRPLHRPRERAPDRPSLCHHRPAARGGGAHRRRHRDELRLARAPRLRGVGRAARAVALADRGGGGRGGGGGPRAARRPQEGEPRGPDAERGGPGGRDRVGRLARLLVDVALGLRQLLTPARKPVLNLATTLGCAAASAAYARARGVGDARGDAVHRGARDDAPPPPPLAEEAPAGARAARPRLRRHLARRPRRPTPSSGARASPPPRRRRRRRAAPRRSSRRCAGRRRSRRRRSSSTSSGRSAR